METTTTKSTTTESSQATNTTNHNSSNHKTLTWLFTQATQHEHEAETRLLQDLDDERQKQQHYYQTKQFGGSNNNNKKRRSHKQPPIFADNLPKTKLPEHDDDDDDDVEQEEEEEPQQRPNNENAAAAAADASTTASPPPPPTHTSFTKTRSRRKKKPSLASRTRYLMALHQLEHTVPRHNNSNTLQQQHPRPPLQTSSASSSGNSAATAPTMRNSKKPLINMDWLVDAHAADRLVHAGSIFQAASAMSSHKKSVSSVSQPTTSSLTTPDNNTTNTPSAPEHLPEGLPHDEGLDEEEQALGIISHQEQQQQQQQSLAQSQTPDSRQQDNGAAQQQQQPPPPMSQESILPKNNNNPNSTNNGLPFHTSAAPTTTTTTHTGGGKGAAASVQAAFHQGLEATWQEWSSLHDFWVHKKRRIHHDLVLTGCGVMAPCLLVAVILFYGADNPPTGRCTDGPCGFDAHNNPVASASWWVLFLGVRFPVTWLLSRATDVLMIDWLVLQHPWCVKLLGPRTSLWIVQSKGWPSMFFWCSFWSAILLYGSGPFSNHWLFWQDAIRIFTKENASGDVTTAKWWRNLIISALIVALSVSGKRYFVGLYLGHRLYSRFHERVEEAMKLITLVSELALWARRKRDLKTTFSQFVRKNSQEERESNNNSSHHGASSSSTETSSHHGASSSNETNNSSHHDASKQTNNKNNSHHGAVSKETNNSSHGAVPEKETAATKDITQERDRKQGVEKPGDPHHTIKNVSSSGLRPYEEINYQELMEPWTDPPRTGSDDVSGNEIIEFQQGFAVMTKPFFFTSAFGPVESRHECIQNSDILFRRLLIVMKGSENGNDSINLNDLTNWMYKGLSAEEHEKRAADLVSVFSPDNDGCIGTLEFVQGIDSVYKKVRLLENAIKNASHIDRSYERLINIFFYLLLGVVVMAILNRNILTLVVALSSFILGFSFLLGSGCAQLFQGILLILGRQPYDIGDRVAIDAVDVAPNMNGSTHWLIEKIDLVTTTARLTGTNEVASFSNGSISLNRIINMNRSPDALVYVYVRFETEVPYSTIMVFKSAVQAFVNERPQEWQGMMGFRTNRVEAQENFVEYMIVLQHRLSWQSLGSVLESKAAVATFCVELQNQLGCHYSAPSMPVTISTKKTQHADEEKDDAAAGESGSGDGSDQPLSSSKTRSAADPLTRFIEVANLFDTPAKASATTTTTAHSAT